MSWRVINLRQYIRSICREEISYGQVLENILQSKFAEGLTRNRVIICLNDMILDGLVDWTDNNMLKTREEVKK